MLFHMGRCMGGPAVCLWSLQLFQKLHILVIWFTCSEKWRWGGVSKFCPGCFPSSLQQTVHSASKLVCYDILSNCTLRSELHGVPTLEVFLNPVSHLLWCFFPSQMILWVCDTAGCWMVPIWDRADTSVVILFCTYDRKLNPEMVIFII